MICTLRFGCPDKETADRMSAIQRIKQSADLISVPDVSALKFWQSHVTAINMIKDC